MRYFSIPDSAGQPRSECNWGHRIRLLGRALTLLLASALLWPWPGKAQAQADKSPSFFRDDTAPAANRAVGAARPPGRALLLDTALLRTTLRQAAPAGSSARGGTGLVLALPQPDGSTARFQIYESSVMAPALAARYPQIKTYSGVGLDDPTASIALDFTPLGFHAQVLSATAGTSYIDPVGNVATVRYRSISRQDLYTNAPAGFQCGTDGPGASSGNGLNPGPLALKTTVVRPPVIKRTYRLALACTPEYAAVFTDKQLNDFDNRNLVLSAMLKTINRVNGIFERELAVHLELIPNNDMLVFFGPFNPPFPYTNSSTVNMIDENQRNIDAIIPRTGYDIGHVFATCGGGLAELSGISSPAGKARGVTGLLVPKGDGFDVDYVSHEIGHQFGATHVFNTGRASSGTCTITARNRTTALEPGSGSTIMGYAGNCLLANLQKYSDDYFNGVNLVDIKFTLLPLFPGIGKQDTLAQKEPTVGTFANAHSLVLPKGTPFRLELPSGSVSSDNPKSLTYCWEQDDIGPEGLPIPDSPDSPDATPPLFRSWHPNSKSDRCFPRISDLLSNVPKIGERLPMVKRKMSFNCTVRDMGNTIGAYTIFPFGLSVTESAGPFKVKPNKVTWGNAQSSTLDWEVANTDVSPVSCSHVNVSLLGADGIIGIQLLTHIPNNGTCTVSVPAGTLLYLEADRTENYFFAIGKTSGEVTKPTTVVGKLLAFTGIKSASSAALAGGSDLKGPSSIPGSPSQSSLSLAPPAPPAPPAPSGAGASMLAWKPVPNADGSYAFLFQGKKEYALDVSLCDPQTGTGLRVAAYDANAPQQSFLLGDTDNGRVRIFTNDNTGRILEAYKPTGATTAALRLVPYTATATDGQQWRFVPNNPDAIIGKVYNLRSLSGKNIQTDGAATTTLSLAVGPNRDNLAAAQQWTLAQQPNGNYCFVSVAQPGKALGIGTSSSVTGNTLTLAQNGLPSQEFQLVASSPGFYKFMNPYTLPGSSANTRAWIEIDAAGRLRYTLSSTPAGTDWQLNDPNALSPASSYQVSTMEPTVGTDKILGAGTSAGAVLTTSATPYSWVIEPILAPLATGAAAVAAAATSGFALLPALLIGVTASASSSLAMQVSLSGPRRALLAVEDGSEEQTFQLGRLANGKYLILDFDGEHALTRDPSSGVISEAAYTGAVNQQWDFTAGVPASGPNLLSGGMYKITSRTGADQVVQVTSPATGSPATTALYTQALGQHWSVAPGASSTATTPTWSFVAQNDASQRLAVPATGVASGQAVLLAPNSPSTAQEFKLTPTTDGFFRITTANGALCLQTTASGVVLAASASSETQEWRFDVLHPAAIVYDTPSPSFTGASYARPLAPGRYTQAQLSVLGIAPSTVSAVQLNPDYEILLFQGDNFTGPSWRYTTSQTTLSAGGNNQAQSIIVQHLVNQLVNGIEYTIRNRTTGDVLQVPRPTTGTAVQTGPGQLAAHQRWQAAQDGFTWSFRPMSAPTQRLNVPAATSPAGATLLQIASNGSPTAAQSFQLLPSADGYFQVATSDGTRCLEKTTSGVQVMASTGSTAQQWAFEAAAPATLFAGPDFAGAMPLAVGSYTPAQLRGLGVWSAGARPSDTLRLGSLRVAKGYEVRLSNATGAIVGDYFTDQAQLAASGVLTLQVLASPVAATAYADANYTSPAVTLPEGSYFPNDLRALGLDEQTLSSVQVKSGYEVLAFGNPTFSGSLWYYRRDQSNLTRDMYGNNADNQAQSLLVRKATTLTKGTTYALLPVAAIANALVLNTNAANGAALTTTPFNELPTQAWVAETTSDGLWAFHRPAPDSLTYVDAPDLRAGTALTSLRTPGFYPQPFQVVNVAGNVWRIMAPTEQTCVAVGSNGTSVALATGGAFDDASQTWYLTPTKAGVTSTVVAKSVATPIVTLFPNPATASITLQDLPLGAVVTITDLTGQTKLTSTQAEISLAGLAPGMYIANVGRQHLRFIKQ